MILFLHENGYNFFNIPKLTYPEIDSLISAKNRQVKKQEQAQKKAQRKAKKGKRR
ncbi:MAG: hypothetical protein ACTSPI_14335 [Candidatus Heimdallarchaeaceae archaeon]